MIDQEEFQEPGLYIDGSINRNSSTYLISICIGHKMLSRRPLTTSLPYLTILSVNPIYDRKLFRDLRAVDRSVVVLVKTIVVANIFLNTVLNLTIALTIIRVVNGAICLTTQYFPENFDLDSFSMLDITRLLLVSC